ncbi:GNAT family acetyltransferase [uncultured Merdimonas sp.]|uniref:GNAT family acetyltransferase n=1 Tax=uncultured Merdimonas sp. TaxID=2023269 RepID=UPI00320A55DB
MISAIGLNVNALKKEPFSGSHQGMRYYLRAKDDVLTVFLYPEPWSFERTPDEDKIQKEFPFTQDGLAEALAWIEQSYTEQQAFWNRRREDRMHLIL